MVNYPVFSSSSLRRPNGGQELMIRYLTIRDGFNIDPLDSLNAVVSAMTQIKKESASDDLTILCGDRSWTVLKSIACPVSGFLNGLCDSRSQETQEGKIVLKEVDPLVLDRVLQFMNVGQTLRNRSLSDDMQFYLLALYLDIPVLQGYVISRCENHYFANTKSVEALLKTTDVQDSPSLIDTFRELFSKTTVGNGMRLILMRCFLKWYTSWNFKKNEFISLFQVEEPDAWTVLCGMQAELNVRSR